MWGISLFVLAFGALFSCVFPFVSKNRIRTSAVLAYLGVSLYVVLSTELLSAFHAIRRDSILMAWAVFILACVLFFVRGVHRHCMVSWRRVLETRPFYGVIQEVSGHKLCALCLLYMLVITFAGAFLYSPNTYDALTYHMTRIMHWLQHQDVTYFVCNDERLNYQLPLVEFMIMHFQLLLGQDYLANIVQWNAFWVSMVSVSLIAEELGLNRKIQWASALILATTPNILFQAQSTQNDLFVGGYVLLFVLYMLKLGHTITWGRLLIAGIAMGLSLLAKGTGFLYIGILGPVLALWIVLRHKKRWVSTIGKCAFIAMIGVSLVTPVFLRNYNHYHSFLALSSNDDNDFGREKTEAPAQEYFSSLKGKEIFLNGIRNMSLHFGLPCNRWNSTVEKGLTRVFGKQFVSSENTPHMTARIQHVVQEDYMGNFVHLFLFTLFLLMMVIHYALHRKRMSRGEECVGSERNAPVDYSVLLYSILSWFTASTLFTALSYTVVLARYHVPFFAMFSVSIAYGLYTFVTKACIRRALFFLLLACAVYLLHNNQNHPLGLRMLKNLRCETIQQNHNLYLFDKHVQCLRELKNEIITRGETNVLFHNRSDQRDYQIYKILGGPLQEEIQIHRIFYRNGESYDTPLFFVTHVDSHRKEYLTSFIPSIEARLIFSNDFFGLYDLRHEKSSIVLPMLFTPPYSWSLFSDAFCVEEVGEKTRLTAEMIFSIANGPSGDVCVDIRSDANVLDIETYRYFLNDRLLRTDQIPKRREEKTFFSLRIPNEFITEGERLTVRLEFEGKQKDELPVFDSSFFHKIHFYEAKTEAETKSAP